MIVQQKSIINIEAIKQEISSSIGKQIKLKLSNKQGKIIKEYVGTIVSSYKNLFLIKINIGKNIFNKSFSFIEFISGELTYSIA